MCGRTVRTLYQARQFNKIFRKYFRFYYQLNKPKDIRTMDPRTEE